jgi:phenylalanyl-tRNA synthetase beta chain
MHPRASFSEIKGAVLSLFSSQGREVEIRAAEHGPYVNGRCAEIVLDGAPIGFMGEISPEVLAAFNLEQPVCAVEIQI